MRGSGAGSTEKNYTKTASFAANTIHFIYLHFLGLFFIPCQVTAVRSHVTQLFPVFANIKDPALRHVTTVAHSAQGTTVFLPCTIT